MVAGPLRKLFDEINATYFDHGLTTPVLRWNRRLTSSAGRFIPARRKRVFRLMGWVPDTGAGHGEAAIEIASYLLTIEGGLDQIRDTLGHEMIHYWLWCHGRPYGHSPEFHEKMREMGVSRYNAVPKHRKHKYVYVCPACARNFPTRKRLGILACADCCKTHNRGKFDSRFTLKISGEQR